MDDIAALIDADGERYRAMREADLVALERLLSADLVYTHSSALCESKNEYLASMASGRFRYLDTQTTEVSVRVYGDAAVMNGRCRFHAIVDGVERILGNRFLSVWVRDAIDVSRWRMAAWASTPIPK